MSLLQYYWTRQLIVASGEVKIHEYCNSIMVVNIGPVIAYVNGFPIHPASNPALANGEVWAIGGNQGEIITPSEPTLDIQMGAGGQLFLQQKYYIPVCFR